MNNNQEQNINRYLNNEMSETERIAFEEQIRNDKALADEVAFQRGFAGFLGRYQPSLESKLENLGDKYIITPTKEKSYKWLILSAILLLSAIVVFIIFNKKTTSNIDTNNSSNSTIETQQETPTQIPIIEEDTIENNDENTIPFVPTIDKIEPKKGEQNTDNQPIASIDESLYERNPNMELVIQNTVRTNDNVQLLTIVEPINDAIISAKDLIDFKINGTAKNELNYDIIIFNNQDFNINNNYPIFKTEGKSVEEQSENKIKFNANLPLGKGLYYLIIQPENSRQILHISRFEVR
ncbi:MAG: hypothetical protein AB8G11_03725 [Saprospiraceae bacterium]